MQVTKVYSADARVSDTAERKMHHHNHGCALGTIVLALNKKKPIAAENLDEMDRKRKAQENAVWPFNKKYGFHIPQNNIK